MTQRKRLGRGKTKIVTLVGPGLVSIKHTDDITAGDGLKHDILPNKSGWTNTVNSNIFQLLNRKGIATHFLKKTGKQTFRARQLRMIAVEVVIRRRAFGSYLKRNPDMQSGSTLPSLVVEYYEKNDQLHDPFLIFDFSSSRVGRYAASQPLAIGFIDEGPISNLPVLGGLTPKIVAKIEKIAKSVFLIIEQAWATQGVVMPDLKIEFGFDVMTGELLLGDDITPDSGRLWPGGDPTKAIDKQVYRDLNSDDPVVKAAAMKEIGDNYAKVAEMTDRFVAD